MTQGRFIYPFEVMARANWEIRGNVNVNILLDYLHQFFQQRPNRIFVIHGSCI